MKDDYSKIDEIIEEKQDKRMKKEKLKEFTKWLEAKDRQNWEIERYVESILE